MEQLTGSDAALSVFVGQARLLTTKEPIVNENGIAVIAVGDPTVVDFEVLPNPRLIRIMGRRAGVTDLMISTADGQTHVFEVHVVYDLDLLSAYLKQLFPDALLNLSQIHEHLVVQGQARSGEQVTQIVRTLEAYLASIQAEKSVEGRQGRAGPNGARMPGRGNRVNGQVPSELEEGGARDARPEAEDKRPSLAAGPDLDRPTVESAFVSPRIINQIRVPGVQQVLLQVRMAELNRTALREVGADILGVDPSNGTILGTRIGGATVSALGILGLGGLTPSASGATNGSTTAFGIFPSGDFEILLRALRDNSVLSILAEPNLMAMSGHKAEFLAGGQFPVPVPQGIGGLTGSVTIQFKDFGVQLYFLPDVLDEERIRLWVSPEVSSIDESLGTTLVQGGDPIPGISTRRAATTVELREGETLAIAGLLQFELEAHTARIPGLGDLPVVGPMFSNTSHKRVEKELLVLVTPHLVAPMRPHEVPPLPGSELKDPTDLEFYLLNRIEGRTGVEFRPTTSWDDPLGALRLMKLERCYVCGPVGFSE